MVSAAQVQRRFFGSSGSTGSTAATVLVDSYGAVGDYNGSTGTDDTVAVQAALTAAPNGSRIVFGRGKNYLVGNLTLSGKTNVVVDGNGATLTLKSTGSRSGFGLTGTCTNVTVRDLTVKGSAVLADAHFGIGFFSGQTIVGAKFLFNRIVDCTIGIILQADASGSMRDCLVEGNHIENVVGTVTGSGYGIHHANGSTTPDGTRIVGNTVRGAQRYGINHAKGGGSAIVGNTVTDHRATVGDGSTLPAIMVARSGDVTVVGNHVSGGRDSALVIGGSIGSDGGAYSRNIVVVGNVFTTPLDTAPLVVVGAAAPATDGFCEGFVFANNVLYSANASTLLQILSGKRGRFSNNVFEGAATSGTTSALRFSPAGESAGTANYTDDLVFENNTFNLVSGGTKNPINLTGGETVASRLTFRANSFTVPGNVFAASTAVTNPNMTITGQLKTGINFTAGVGPAAATLNRSRKAVADADYTVLVSNEIVAYTSLTASRTVTLPAVADANGQVFTVKDESGSCSPTVTVVIAPASGTIDGASSLTLRAPYAQATLYCNGTNWFTAPGAAANVDVQVFTASGTWTKPAGAKLVEVIMIPAGSGGGSGRRGAAGTIRCGGGGGPSGGYARMLIPASSLPSSVAVSVPAQSLGGAAVTTDDTNGNNAGSVAASTFSTYVRAGTNLFAASGGTASAGSAGTAGTGTYSGNAGGAAANTGTTGAGGSGGASGSGAGAGGGGGGGSITASDVSGGGGNGGNITVTSSVVATGGVVGGASPAAATTQPVGSALPGHGGGGGAAGTSTSAGTAGTAAAEVRPGRRRRRGRPARTAAGTAAAAAVVVLRSTVKLRGKAATVARRSQSSPHTSEPAGQVGESRGGVQRWVVVPTDRRRKTILSTGAYLWDGVTPWEPPEQGRLMLEAEALDGGYTFPDNPAPGGGPA